MERVRRVAVPPASTRLTSTPVCGSVVAIASVSPSTANLDAQYASAMQNTQCCPWSVHQSHSVLVLDGAWSLTMAQHETIGSTVQDTASGDMCAGQVVLHITHLPAAYHHLPASLQHATGKSNMVGSKAPGTQHQTCEWDGD